MTLDRARKFLTLDALRGVAALAVVEFHASSFVGQRVVRHGYLAVDFFFMLSGFVLTFAYQDRLDRGWSTLSFLKVRFIRLYPLYLLGLLIGLSLRLLDHAFGKPMLSGSALLMLGVCGLTLVPMPVQLAEVSDFSFPLNVPSWSLCFEAIANVFHALLLRRRGWVFTTGLTAAIALVYGWFVMRTAGMDFGSRRIEFLPGLMRVLLFYSIGVLLFKAWSTERFTWGIPSWLGAVVLPALLIGPAIAYHRTAYDLIVALICFPVLLLLCVNSEPSPRFATAFQTLGIASYAIYILHVPIAAAYFAGLRMVLKGGRFEVLAGWETLALMALVLIVALAVDRIYDQPVRRLLRARLEGRRG